MTVSVIITAYNLEKYVSEAIQSVINQTRKADEIIVVDDCSTDSTAAIIDTFGNQVKYLKMPQNSGGLSTTFYGLRNAQGDILMFLDADDYWMPEKIESVVPLFEKFPQMGVVSHNYIRVNGVGKQLNVIDDTQENIEKILAAFHTPEEQSEAFKESILAKKGFWGGSAYSLRRSLVDIDKFEHWRQSFPFIRNTYLDLVLPTFILVNHPAIMVGYVHKELFAYRQHGANTSGNTIPKVDAAIKALKMGHCTTMATHGLLQKQKDYAPYADAQYLHLLEYEYLENVYRNQKIAACKKFVYLSKKFWRRKQILKESQRLGISLVFGPSVFLHLKKWKVS
ncbi:MAG: glycosyltransferase [Chitinophagaceae bacterium]|nr:MAG: glycosyltransferase [Chitinophagaceae bacterium]